MGAAILDVLRREDPALAEGMIVNEGEQSSYTFVLSPPGRDRSFLHCPGANDTFGANDIDYDEMAEARLFHFGYPPLMRFVYANDGEELETIFRNVKQRGLTTSLDMAYVDPNSGAADVDWQALLECVLPHVDVFLPSLDEILFMIDRRRFEQTLLSGDDKGDHTPKLDGAMLLEIADRLLAMGAAIVVLKLGDQGLYLLTTGQSERLETSGRCKPQDAEAWLGREILAPCFLVDVAGTTGSGDCTIAGFHAGMLHGQAPEDAVLSAAAVGACNVEQPDATSGIRPWAAVQERIRSGWERRSVTTPLLDWRHDVHTGLWMGPHDAGLRNP